MSLEDQADWDGHAAFMNELHRAGFVTLGGLLEGSPDVLLIIRTNSREEIMERLKADPWSAMDLLRIERISPWTLRLGSLH